MYADDIVLIAISISDLKKLLEICIAHFDTIDMPFNIMKSMCMRFWQVHAILSYFININRQTSTCVRITNTRVLEFYIDL